MSKDTNTKIINITFLLSIFLCGIFIIVSYAKYSSSNYYYVSSIGENWSKGTISDVEADGSICSNGKQSIINGEWAGTQTGCFCRGIFDTLRIGSCAVSSSSTNNGIFCSRVQSIPPKPMKIWKNVNLCGKIGPNYLQLKTANTPNACGNKYKSCGIIDTIGNYLCYPIDSQCPYNYMKEIGPNDNIPTDKNYTVIGLGIAGKDGKMLLSNEFPDKNLISDFKIDDNSPCVSPQQYDFTHTPYLLENSRSNDVCSTTIDGQKLDQNYEKVDSTTYNNLYSDNQINGLLSQLPEFSTKYNYLSQTTNLYKRNFIGMRKECLNKMLQKVSAVELIENLKNSQSHGSTTSTIALIAMIIGIIGIVFGIYGAITVLGKGTLRTIFYSFNVLGVFLVNFPVLVFGFILLGFSSASGYDFTPLGASQCSDQVTTYALNSFSSNMNSAHTMGIAYLICGIIGCIANAIFIFNNKNDLSEIPSNDEGDKDNINESLNEEAGDHLLKKENENKNDELSVDLKLEKPEEKINDV